MQETMWSNSCRRKEGITCALWFHASVYVYKDTFPRTHMHTCTNTWNLQPPEHKKPSIAEGARCFQATRTQRQSYVHPVAGLGGPPMPLDV